MENKVQVTPDNFESFLPMIEEYVEAYSAFDIENWDSQFLKDQLNGVKPRGRGWDHLNRILNQGNPKDSKGFQYIIKLREARQTLNDENDGALIKEIDSVIKQAARYHSSLSKGTIYRVETCLKRAAGEDKLVKISEEQAALFFGLRGKFNITHHMYWSYRSTTYEILHTIFEAFSNSFNDGNYELYQNQIDYLFNFYGGFIKKLEAAKKKFPVGQLAKTAKGIKFDTSKELFLKCDYGEVVEPEVLVIVGDVYPKRSNGNLCVQTLINGKIVIAPINYLRKPTKKELRG